MKLLSADALVRAFDREDWTLLWIQAMPLAPVAIRSMARRGYTVPDHLTDDAAQQARLFVGEAIRKWRPFEAPFCTWVLGATIWQLMDWLRTEAGRGISGRARVSMADLDEVSPYCITPDDPDLLFEPVSALVYEHPPAGYGDPCDEVEREQTLRALHEAVAGLRDPAARAALTAVYGLTEDEEVSPAEYSRTTGEPDRTVRDRLERARRRLEKKMAGLH